MRLGEILQQTGFVFEKGLTPKNPLCGKGEDAGLDAGVPRRQSTLFVLGKLAPQDEYDWLFPPRALVSPRRLFPSHALVEVGSCTLTERIVLSMRTPLLPRVRYRAMSGDLEVVRRS